MNQATQHPSVFARSAFSAVTARAGVLKRQGAGSQSDFKAVSSVLYPTENKFLKWFQLRPEVTHA